MDHYVAYHSVEVMGRTYVPTDRFEFHTRKPDARKSIGSWAWVIVGQRQGAGRSYRLMGVYTPSAVTELATGFVVQGSGIPLRPPIDLEALTWFRDLLDEQGNFGFGFNLVRAPRIVSELERILAGTLASEASPLPPAFRVFQQSETNSEGAAFEEWCREHPHGFVLNCLSRSRGVVHVAECGHLTTMPGQDFTRLRKACSASIAALGQWAAGELLQTQPCTDCSPVDSEEALAAHAAAMLEEGAFSVEGITDARVRVQTTIVQRQGQPAFRRALLDAYEGRCAITGCDLEPVLEAAHIVPYRGASTNHPQNGLLLRADLHTLFDLGLVSVDARTMCTIIAPRLEGSPYASLAGGPVALPRDVSLHPSKQALDHHREQSGLTHALRRTATEK